MKKLNNWYLTGHIPAETDPWNAPEVQVPAVSLGGWVENHSDFMKGDHIRCSPIKEIVKQNDTLFVTTASGSIYELGELEPTYAKMFPNAKERLFKQFNQEKQFQLGKTMIDPEESYEAALDSTVTDMCRRMMDPEVYELGFKNNHYKYIEKHGKVFSDALGIDDVTKSLVADGDKCRQYKDEWEEDNVPFVIGAMIYIASKESKYSNTVRQTDKGFVKPCQWVIDKFKTDPEIIAAVKAVRATYE